jgi:formylglycine-generating enzyme required for sulfatase activity
MVLIPAGEFLMGSTDADKDAASDEKPQHKVYLDAYDIDLTEVTNTMYRACVEAGVCSKPSCSYYDDSGRAQHPVVCVDWNQAVAYCEWRGARLPTEAEWEKAARGTDGRIYPWGESIECDRANYGGTYGCVGDTTKVGSYPSGASPYGLLDMAGNVWEWVQDWYLETFYQNTPFENPLGPSSGEYRVLRGGSWYGNDNYLRVAVRYNLNPTGQISSIGFRCGASPAP